VGVVRILWILLAVWRRGQSAAKESEGGDDLWSHPTKEDLPGDLERIARAGRHLACFFSRSDPGYPLLTFSAAKKVEEMSRAGRLSVHFIEDADHTFTRRAARQALEGAILEHLCRRYPR